MINIYAIDCYTDLITEIEIGKIRIEQLEAQRKELQKLLGGPKELTAMQYNDMPVGNGNAMSIDRLVDTIHKISSKIDIEKSLMEGMITTQVLIYSKLKGLKGFDYQVIFKRDIENKSFEVISAELFYSSRQIRRVYDKINMANNVTNTLI